MDEVVQYLERQENVEDQPGEAADVVAGRVVAGRGQVVDEVRQAGDRE